MTGKRRSPISGAPALCLLRTYALISFVFPTYIAAPMDVAKAALSGMIN